jgi:hypothetical protein
MGSLNVVTQTQISAVPAYRRSVRCVLLMLAICGYNSDAINTALRSALQVKGFDWC